jgi:hypothetical protein
MAQSARVMAALGAGRHRDAFELAPNSTYAGAAS